VLDANGIFFINRAKTKPAIQHTNKIIIALTAIGADEIFEIRPTRLELDLYFKV
jgi:hypothetical protein